MMDTLSLHAYPDVSKQPALTVTLKDPELTSLISALIHTLKDYRLEALSGPHVHIPYQLIAVQAGEHFDTPVVLINPKVIEQSGSHAAEEECLFFPGMSVSIPRCDKLTMTYETMAGEEKILNLEGRWAGLLNYHLDVLNGKFVIDHLSALKRKRFLDKYNKKLKLGQHCGPQCTHEHH